MYAMPRICLALDLKDNPELIAAYEEHHQKVWPEILQSIAGTGILDMEIYRTGNRLFMIMEVTESFDAAEKARADAENPIVQEWEELMWEYQQAIPWAEEGEKWVTMDRIFSLRESVSGDS